METEYKRSTRLIPTPDDWAPAIFNEEQFILNETLENEQVAKDYAWEGEYIGSFSREDYLPATHGAYVEGFVTYQITPDLDGYYLRVSFWGNDDTGLEQDFIFQSREQLLQAYYYWCCWLGQLAYASISQLRTVGFVNA